MRSLLSHYFAEIGLALCLIVTCGLLYLFIRPNRSIPLWFRDPRPEKRR